MLKGSERGSPQSIAQRGSRMSNNRAGAGPEGYCVCPVCGKKVSHKGDIPCMNASCPKCGTKMVRE
jgi:hypothetical protein